MFSLHFGTQQLVFGPFLIFRVFGLKLQLKAFVHRELRLAQGHPKLLLLQAAVQSLRLRLQDGRDWTASDDGQRVSEVMSQREQPLAVSRGLLDKLRPLLLVHSQ